MSSLLEFFVPDHLRPRPVDAEGFELPPWLNPFFQIPPDDDQVEAFEPSLDDVAWLNENPILPPISGGSPAPFVPSAQDWADYEAFSREVDARHEMQRMDDAEYEARARFG